MDSRYVLKKDWWIENTGTGELVFYAICTPRFRPENYRDRSQG